MRRPKQQPVAKGKTKTRKQSSDARKRPKRPRSKWIDSFRSSTKFGGRGTYALERFYFSIQTLQNKHISFHTALPLFAKSKAYPICKRETRNTYHNHGVKNLPIKIPHRFLTHVEKSDFDTNEQNLAVTMSPYSLVRVWPLFADFNSIS